MGDQINTAEIWCGNIAARTLFPCCGHTSIEAQLSDKQIAMSRALMYELEARTIRESAYTSIESEEWIPRRRSFKYPLSRKRPASLHVCTEGMAIVVLHTVPTGWEQTLG